MAKVKVLDGGFSSQLSTHVGDRIDGDPLWTARFLITNPDAVLATHLDYLRGGSDIIETNTYQASVTGFVKHLNISENESLQLISNAVDLAKRAVEIYNQETRNSEKGNKNPLVAGSCGPYGASLHDQSEFTGSYASSVSLDFLKNWHRPRIEALIKAGVDMLALETVPCPLEAEALISLLKEFPKMKAWLSFSCRDDGKSLADGSSFKEIALKCFKEALPGQLVAVGVNCIAPKLVASLFRDINQDTKEFIPLVVYPNSGEKFSNIEGWKAEEDLKPLETFVHEWLNLGVRFLGGCCRTYAEDITKIRSEVEKWETEKEQK